MAKLAETLSSLAQVAGLDEAAQKNLVTAAGTVDIDDAHHATLTGSLITTELAKQNQDLKNHFIGQFTQGFDQSFNENIEAFDLLTPDQRAQIKAEQSTGKKQTLALNLIKKQHAAALASVQTGGASEAAKKQIEDLQKAITEKETAIAGFDTRLQTEVSKVKGEASQHVRQAELGALFAGLAWRDDFPAESRSVLASSAMNTKLAQIGGKLVRVAPMQYVIKNAQSEELDVLIENKPYTFAQLQSDIMVNYIKKNPNPAPAPVIIPAPSGPDATPHPHAGRTAWSPFSN